MINPCLTRQTDNCSSCYREIKMSAFSINICSTLIFLMYQEEFLKSFQMVQMRNEITSEGDVMEAGFPQKDEIE